MARATTLPVLLTAALLACKPAPPTDPVPVMHRFAQTDTLGDVSAMARGSGGNLWLALDDDFALRESTDSGFSFVSRGDLPRGQITFLGTIDGSREWLFAHVHGHGFYRNWANSSGWDRVEGLQSPLLQVLRPGLRPIPTGMVTSADGVTWLSTVGGLYFTSDEGVTWDRADTTSSGDVNIVFTDVDTHDTRVAAVALLPEGLIPEQFAGVLNGRVFLSDNSGLTWSTPDEAFTSNHPTSVAVADDGTVYVGTMDDGVLRDDGNGVWTPVSGPTDVIDVEWVSGGLSVASATRGLWRLENGDWTAAGDGGAVGVTGGLGVLRSGQVYEVQDGQGDAPPDPANGTVHVAVSFFVNAYHSTRGDQPDESGFGQDIRVITDALDWLDAHPTVRADWVFENEQTLDDRLPTYAPELLARIDTRIRSGQDDVRIMSSTAAPMASLTPAEATMALERAKVSTDAAFGEYVPGVQPADSMVTGDNIGLYGDQGFEWMSLFYGANGFTGPRNTLTLNGANAHNPFILTDPVNQRSIQVMPVYHHADLLDHGGLEGWARQLNANHDQDTLIAIHFDADAESWENFDRELADVLELPFVQFTTLHDYVSTHPGGPDLNIVGDIANGSADGFSSWSEKASSQELWTIVERARRLDETAAFIAPADGTVREQIELATQVRLELLAANNFGLTAPSLHPERFQTAVAQAQTAMEEATEAYDLAVAAATPLGPQELEVLNATGASALTTVPLRLRLPAGAWEGEAGLVVERDDDLLAIRAELAGTFDGYDLVDVEADLVVTPYSRTRLDWSYDPGETRHVQGSLSPADIPSTFLLQPPFVECTDGTRMATRGPTRSIIGEWGLVNTSIEEWDLPSCQGGSSSIQRTISRRHEFPGVFIEVDGTIDQSADSGGLLSMVLAPITCPSGVERLTWPSYGGTERTRVLPEDLNAANPISADGWFEATCGDGSTVRIAVDQTVRSAMGMVSVRNRGEGLLAPLGALFEGSPWHDAARTGGTGMADLVTPLVGSQFQPSAPDWAGDDVKMRMWVTTGTDADRLRLFANPPLVRAPEVPHTP